jgi:potassium efflux system protein
MKQFIVVLCLCLVSVLSFAQPADPGTPNPAALSSDWWRYFEPEEKLSAEELHKRVTETQQRLNALLQQTGGKEKVVYKSVISQINTQLDRFEKLKSTETPIEKLVHAPLDSYNLKDALARYNQWRQLKKESEVSKEDIDWRSAILTEERKQQSRRRNQYLELEKNSPQRFLKGLELMLSRIKLELQRLDVDRQKMYLASVESELENLQAELEIIPQRLVGTNAELLEWQKEYDTVQEKLSKLSAQPGQIKSEDLGLQSDDSEMQMIQARYSVLVGVQKEVLAAVLKLRLIKARLAQQLIKLLIQKETADTGAIRQLLSEYKKIQVQTDANLNAWKKASQRLQSYASGLTTEQIAQDPNVAKLKNKALSLSGNIENALRELSQERANADYFSDLLEQKLQASEGLINRGVQNATHVAKQTWEVGLELLSTTLFEINEVPVTMLGLLRIVLILFIAWWLSKGIRNGLQRIGERRTAVSKSSLYTLGRIVHYIILIIGVIIGLSSIGIDFTKFALFASALGVGIGFGLQTLISNFVAGLIILFEKSLKVGDFVELASGVAGEVREINMRSTLITTNDNIDILVPNSEFVAGRVTNWTLREAYRRIHVPFGVAYGTDKELVKKAVLEAADEVQWTLKGKKGRSPQVWFVQFGDSSLNFELVVWLTPEAVKRPNAVQAHYLWEIETKLNKYDIEIPFPQRDLHLRSAFGKKDEAGLSLLPGSVVE